MTKLLKYILFVTLVLSAFAGFGQDGVEDTNCEYGTSINLNCEETDARRDS